MLQPSTNMAHCGLPWGASFDDRHKNRRSDYDAVVHNTLLTAAREMRDTIQRTSFSPVIYEDRDFACGLLDADANTLAEAPGLTAFMGTLSPGTNVRSRSAARTISHRATFSEPLCPDSRFTPGRYDALDADLL